MIEKRTMGWIWAAVMLLVSPGAAAMERAAADIPVKRCAFLVGANNGGPQREELKYAVSDAGSLRGVLEEMGGVSAEDSFLLADPDRRRFFQEMERIQQKVKQLRSRYNRIEFIFYYSGHSDESHILLGSEKIPYQDIQAALDGVESDVKIAILDSCASGAFTRLKGGRKRLPFLWDAAYNMKGYAVMTSSSSLEASQESDQIGGSFFTHFLISGMRGAADLSRDGKVTLHEAYQFAFDETLARTVQTRGGPQHPNYDIQMNGTGDVIMTDIRQSSAVLRLAGELSGKVFVYGANKILAAELNKPFGRDVELGLEAGKYRIIILKDGKAYLADADLGNGKTFALAEEGLTKSKKIPTVLRGWDPLHFQRNGPGKISFRISGGLGNLMQGDIHTWVDAQNKFFANYAEKYPLISSNGWKNFQIDVEPEGECRLKLNDRFALAIGSGYLWRKFQSEAEIEKSLDEKIHYTSALQFQAIPLKASLYYLFPLRSHAQLFLRGGAVYYFGTINYLFSYSTTGANHDEWEKNEGKARDGNLGLHAGIGLEFRLSRKVAFSVEGQAVYCRLNDWEGRETFTDDTGKCEVNPGTMYLDGEKYYGELLPLPSFLSYTANGTRRFTVDLSGFSLKAGFIICL